MRVMAMHQLADTKGMTLLEVTIALFILAIGLLGLAGLQMVALRGDTLGQQATLATTLAKNKVVEIQESNQLSGGVDQYVDQANGMTYTREWIVESDQSDLAQTATRTVKVQVTWRGAMADRCITVRTVIQET